MGNIISNNIEWAFTHIFGEGPGTQLLAEARAAAQGEITKEGAVVEANVAAQVTAKIQALLPIVSAHLPAILRPFVNGIIAVELPQLVQQIVDEAVAWAATQVLGSGATVPAPATTTETTVNPTTATD
jgi:hypothetical protein